MSSQKEIFGEATLQGLDIEADSMIGREGKDTFARFEIDLTTSKETWNEEVTKRGYKR